MNFLTSCYLCPRNCGVNRTENKTGFCKANSSIKIARVSLHNFEEPCISGEVGSGTIFFSNCSLKCVFCQNHDISQQGIGKEISVERLREIFLELQAQGANNINLVTPTHYASQILEALRPIKNTSLNIPVIYNSSGYENVETLKMLRGFVDVYVPDIKYFDSKYSLKYSGVNNYFEIAIAAVNEMIYQVGATTFDEHGLIKSGVIIRHLMLPGLLFDSKKIIDYISQHFSDTVYLSIMNQYTPMHEAYKFPEINKPLNPKHYDMLIDYALSVGIKNGFIQEEGTASTDFVPEFDLRGV